MAVLNGAQAPPGVPVDRFADKTHVAVAEHDVDSAGHFGNHCTMMDLIHAWLAQSRNSSL